ncbi:DoxX family protein [Brevibacillus sp. SYP-B805]|uniref:DoxX family protein n=1 Tax=Brevibacillus sp. SYP-B805 TaxID=1578199 RepID=UPI001F4937A8|nr:DoxX family protein [Brevibacillus sp. SYP-B805]
MIVNWLRNNGYASVLLLLARLYIGWEWLTAGWEKLTGAKGFSAAKFLQNAVAHPVTSHNEVVYPTYTAFLQSFALPHVELFNFLIPWGEFLVGLGLILGCLTTAAGFFGVMMNFAFLLAGTVSSNPRMILFGVFLLVGGRNTGAIGLDRYLFPLFDRWFHKPPNKPVVLKPKK